MDLTKFVEVKLRMKSLSSVTSPPPPLNPHSDNGSDIERAN